MTVIMATTHEDLQLAARATAAICWIGNILVETGRGAETEKEIGTGLETGRGTGIGIVIGGMIMMTGGPKKVGFIEKLVLAGVVAGAGAEVGACTQ